MKSFITIHVISQKDEFTVDRFLAFTVSENSPNFNDHSQMVKVEDENSKIWFHGIVASFTLARALEEVIIPVIKNQKAKS